MDHTSRSGTKEIDPSHRMLQGDLPKYLGKNTKNMLLRSRDQMMSN